MLFTNKIDMKNFNILYARNSNGSINQWAIGAQDDGKIVIWEGLIDSEKPTRTERQCKGKNIGKMNETTAYEQACSEAESRWTLKKKKGYKSAYDLNIPDHIINNKDTTFANEEEFKACLNIQLPKNRTDANNLSKPMLATPMFDPKTGKCKARFPMIGQPKFNGFRMMCRWEKVNEGEGLFKEEVEKPVFRSRDGIRFNTLKHIEEMFTKDMFFYQGEQLAFDGEIYANHLMLQQINSAVNKYNTDTCNLRFFIFDIAIENMIQTKRLEVLDNILSRYDNYSNPAVERVQTIVFKDIESAEKQTDHWIRFKYEGSILRDPKGFYQFGKRNTTMLKLKRFQDKEFLILDVIGGDNTPDVGVFVCKAENGLTFNCTPQGTLEIKKEYLTNKQNYIGKMLTVKFYERTADGKPFHTSGIAIREFM